MVSCLLLAPSRIGFRLLADMADGMLLGRWRDISCRVHRSANEIRIGGDTFAATTLGRLTGRVDVEDILDVIFRDFCIGK